MMTRNGLFADIPAEQWNDWRWQARNRVETLDELKHYIHLTAEEEKAAREAEERTALLARVEELERERTVNSYVNKFLGLGYEEHLAKETAEALVAGDMETVFVNQRAFAVTREKNLRAEILKSTPRPAGGSEPKMDYSGKLREAQAAGDFTAIAYYTRLAQESYAKDE